MVTTEQINAVVEVTKNLTVDELADLVNHPGDRTLEASCFPTFCQQSMTPKQFMLCGLS